jgi:hypothetical protein
LTRIKLTEPLRVVAWLLTIPLVLIMLMLASEMISAWDAQSCSARATSDCYPWGGEGPGAGSWAYASKRNYLLDVTTNLIVSAAALIAGFFLKPAIRLVLIFAAFGSLAFSDAILSLVF